MHDNKILFLLVKTRVLCYNVIYLLKHSIKMLNFMNYARTLATLVVRGSGLKKLHIMSMRFF